jgi:rsbT co-antagonist protein RsbR
MTITDGTCSTLGNEVIALRARVAELEQQLAPQAEAHFMTQVMEAIPGLVYVFDLVERCNVYANRQITEMLGYSVEQMQAMGANPLPSIIHPDDLPHIIDQQQAMANDQSNAVFAYEYRARDVSGTWRWLHSRETMFKRAIDGTPLQSLGYAQDITAQKQAESALKTSQQALALHVQQTPLAYIEWDQSFNVREWNPAAQQIFGWRKEEALGRHAAELMVPESARELVNEVWRNLIAQSGGSRSTNDNLHREGHIIACEWYNTPLVDATGTVIGVASLVQDITEQQRVQAALRDQQHFSERVMEAIPGVVYVADLVEHHNVYANRQFTDVLGYTAEQVQKMGADLRSTIFHPDDLPVVMKREQQILTLNDGKALDIEYRVKNAKGEWRWYADRATVFARDAAGVPFQFLGYSQDITSRKAADAEHQRLQEEIIRVQQVTLAELSTPLIPITDQIVVMPLIGALDTRRVQQVIETLLHGIEQSRAQVAILDITGVPVVDTQVANTLIQAAQAVNLLGARVILTGIRPEVAQTLVTLGVNLGSIVTRSSLQSGIAYATQ